MKKINKLLCLMFILEKGGFRSFTDEGRRKIERERGNIRKYMFKHQLSLEAKQREKGKFVYQRTSFKIHVVRMVGDFR